MADHIGGWSGVFVTLALTLFAFTTILYLYYLGENGLNFFTQQNKVLLNLYRLIIFSQILWGSVQELTTIFALADLAVGLLALGNLIALGFLWPVGMRVLRDYQNQLNSGISEPQFDKASFKELKLDQKAWNKPK